MGIEWKRWFPYGKVMEAMIVSAFTIVPFLSGCAPVVVVGAAGAGAAGIYYTVSDSAYKTFTHPYKRVREALFEASRNMGIEMKSYVPISDGETFQGSTPQLKIEVTIRKITDKTTKVDVDVRKEVLIKDKATATELLLQMDRVLQK